MRRFRKRQFENYSDERYRQRSLIECGFSCLKRKYGGMVRAKKIWRLRGEIYCKGIGYNLGLMREIFDGAYQYIFYIITKPSPTNIVTKKLNNLKFLNSQIFNRTYIFDKIIINKIIAQLLL